MDPKMFCFQCQETAGNTGCLIKGVCGKEASTARLQDLLLFVVRGISVLERELRRHGQDIATEVYHFNTDALFCTITNANFDDESIAARVDRGLDLRDALAERLRALAPVPTADAVTWRAGREAYDAKAGEVGVLAETDADKRSLTELIIYGLKGMAAYVEHAQRLGHEDLDLNRFMCDAMAALTVDELDVEGLIALTLRTGEYGVKSMAQLDAANTGTYGHPEVTEVSIEGGRRPGILISGHDLKDLEMLLEQTEGKGVDVYTHGEMLPAHYYPAFKKYKHFVGNYGNAWWQQREEFTAFNGPILFSRALFMRNATFSKAKFGKEANFFMTVFTKEADFSGSKFSGHASFFEVKFSSSANFFKTKFAENTRFSGAQFNGSTNFSITIFHSKPEFANTPNKNYKAKFSHKAAPEDYSFKTAAKSPYKIETREQEHNGVKFIIPEDAALFDPDNPFAWAGPASN